MKKNLIDILFDLQNDYDFNITFTTNKEYILTKHAADKET